MSAPRTTPSQPLPWLALLAIVVVALNLRPILAATGPLLDTIQASTGLSDRQAGLMTTLPIFVMGLCALLAAPLQRWLGGRWGITLGALVIAVACAGRWLWPNAGSLIATAVLSGLGIALVQALMPSVIKDQFGNRAGMLMGLYSTGIMGGAAFAAALTPGLAQRLDWSAAQALWALPAVAAALLWWWQAQPRQSQVAARVQEPAATPVWRSRRAWLLMLFFGIGTGAYTLVLAWLAPYYMQLGWSSTQSGFLLAGISVGEVCAGLLVSLFIARFPDRRPLLLLVLGLIALALLGLLLMPLAGVVPITLLLSLGIGALFPLSLIITLDHARSPQHAGALLGFVQGGGYMLSSVMPLVAGLLRGGGGGLQLAWAIMIAGCVVLALMAWRFKPLNPAG